MPLPTFSHPAVTIVVQFPTGVASPATIEHATNQSWTLSDAGVPYVYTYGQALETWVFGFANVPADVYQDLLTFFNDPAVNWRESSFTYTDEHGDPWPVQLLDERLQVLHRAIGTYDLGLRLLVRRDLETP
jgi:hypothetical protein